MHLCCVQVEGCIIEDVTEDRGTETGNQQPPRQPLPKQQPRSAAQHTYEHYSRRWERFDADAAVRSDDESEGERPSAAAPKPATGRIQGGAGASAATATGGSPPTPSAQPVLPPRRRAAERAGAVEAGSGAAFTGCIASRGGVMYLVGQEVLSAHDHIAVP